MTILTIRKKTLNRLLGISPLLLFAFFIAAFTSVQQVGFAAPGDGDPQSVQTSEFLAPAAVLQYPISIPDPVKSGQSRANAKCKLTSITGPLSIGSTFQACWNNPPKNGVTLSIGGVQIAPQSIGFEGGKVCGTFSLQNSLGGALVEPGTHEVECFGPGGTITSTINMVTVSP